MQLQKTIRIASIGIASIFIAALTAGCMPKSNPISTTSLISGENKLETNLPYHLDPDRDGDYKGYNYFPLMRKATGRRVFIFDPKHAAWAIYDPNGVRVNTGRASGGQPYCPDVGRPCRTVVGNFSVSSKGDASCISSKYPLETNGGAPMPYCMHFTSKGYAIHGSNDVPNYNASHGCIRVTPTAAEWLSENFMTIGTSVIVLPYSSSSE